MTYFQRESTRRTNNIINRGFQCVTHPISSVYLYQRQYFSVQRNLITNEVFCYRIPLSDAVALFNADTQYQNRTESINNILQRM